MLIAQDFTGSPSGTTDANLDCAILLKAHLIPKDGGGLPAFTLGAAVVAGDLTVEEGFELGSAEVFAGGGIGAVAVTFPFLKLKSGIL